MDQVWQNNRLSLIKIYFPNHLKSGATFSLYERQKLIKKNNCVCTTQNRAMLFNPEVIAHSFLG